MSLRCGSGAATHLSGLPMLVSFVLELITSVILYIVPARCGAGRAGRDRRRPGAARAIPDPIPPGTGSRTIRELCATYHLDQDAVLAALAARGWAAEPTDQIRAIAETPDIAPEDVIAILRKFAP